MKKLPALLMMFITFLAFSCTNSPSDPAVEVMSFNIRYSNPGDGVNAWTNRIPVVKDYLSAEKPDVMGVQEALYSQIIDLQEMLPGYAYLGTGRDDGKQGGEFTPVFYKKERFELVDNGQFWLSETPDVPGSIGWEAVLPRICTWAKLKDIETGDEFYFFNTHYSHVSDLAREQSMIFMADKISEIANDHPIIVTGDFNISSDSDLYQKMENYFLETNNLQNVYNLDSDAEKMSTYNGFQPEYGERIIDHIFVNDHFSVKKYQVDTFIRNGVFLSDHWPVKSALNYK